MSNVLEHTTQHQILALGRLGWTLSRIQATTGVRRETISGYLKAAAVEVLVGTTVRMPPSTHGDSRRS